MSLLSACTAPPFFSSQPISPSLLVKNKLPSFTFKPISKITKLNSSHTSSTKNHDKFLESDPPKSLSQGHIKTLNVEYPCFVIQFAAILAAIEQPALAVTGTVEVDWVQTLISGGITAFLYFIVIPPVIFNWLRLRWYKRKFLEFYLQFMCVFLFFPGMILWAPFLNFRRFPRDPSMKYPWSTPQDPSINGPNS